ncbi:MAG: carboxy terminal-processing peptidase, partial [Planctomycetes bacterium]|nr:carboxy terminal-processing peptidase [Planctomycetota bacterium]
YFAKRMHQFDNDELMEMYLTSIASSYDPHTTFMSKTTLENFDIVFKLKLQGIGAALRSADGETIVTKIIKGGAADKQGKIKPEDRIVAVGEGKEGEMVDIVDMKLNDVVQKIRGKAGTIVRLSVIHQGENEINTYTITRAVIELKESEARSVIFEKGTKANGKPYKMGVIELPSFYMDMEAARLGIPNYKSTTRDVRKLLEDLKAKGVDAVVLDLRNNGGGSLTEAIDCTGLFIDHGPIVQVKGKDDRVSVYNDRKRGVEWDGPLIVVTSKFSASASEILAGAIQDYNRGIIVGDSATHGKGTVQSLLDLGRQMFDVRKPPKFGALKITMQQFYRPSGDSTQKRGVLADVVLPSITQHMDVGEADLDFAIDFDRVPETEFAKLDMVNDNMRSELSARSNSRVKKAMEFKDLQVDIKRYLEQKKKKTVTLNEKQFFAERAKIDANKEEEKKFEEQENNDDEIVKRDFYFEEVLAVAADYVKALDGHKVAAGR